VRNLLALAPGQLVASHWNSGNDLPLAVGNVNLAWAEFEVLETKLAARITRVA
jgi:flagellar motor switch protein FliN/FliY